MSSPVALPRFPRLRRGLLELVLIATLYVGYSASRLVADDALAPALERAQQLLHLETVLGLRWEATLNQLFVEVDTLGLLASYWYATAHYVVTLVALVWLYRLGSERYLPGRRALVIATVLGLAMYLMMPTAPPRFVEGYVDVLSLHAADGWWGTDASAPRGLGGLTNQLAAFPSLHAGWSLWVALVVQRHSSSHAWRVFGWAHAGITAVVIVGTGNHWVVDAVVGWMVVVVGFLGAELWSARERSAAQVQTAVADSEESASVG